MSDKDEALLLADALLGRAGLMVPILPVAAELRRQHAEIESLKVERDALRGERDALQQIVADYPPIEAELEEVSDRAFKAEAECDALRAEVSALQSQVNAFYLGTPESRLLAMTKERDALLEFAKAALRYASNAGDDYLAEKARAAIDAAREAGK